jgi:small subunit ribosomal protein S1
MTDPTPPAEATAEATPEAPSPAPPSEARPANPPPTPDAIAAVLAAINARLEAHKAAAPTTPPAEPELRPEPPRAPALHGVALRRSLNAEIEAELEEALAEFKSGSLLDDLTHEAALAPQPAPPAPGTGGRKRGKIVAIHGDDVFIDIGGRSPGVLSLEQFSDASPEIGQPVDVSIEGYDRANGVLILSKRGAVARHVDWSTVAEGLIVEAKVTGETKGGLTVDVNGIRGFIPISQLELFRVEDLKPYANQKLMALITEANPAEKNLVLSRRALFEQERDEAKKKLWSELAEGQTRSGVVRNIKEFGAFIDLGGVDGLLPIGEMGWGRIEKVEDVLTLGQRLDVFVHRIDHEKHKLTLSLKPLLKSPWDEAGAQFAIGATLTGKVTRLADFGAFVEIAPGVDGLVHVSEISTKRIHRPGDVLKVGQEVVVQIIKVDPGSKRIGLSMKAVQKAAEEAARAEAAAKDEAAADAAEAAKAKKPITRRTDLKGGIGGGGPLFALPGK